MNIRVDLQNGRSGEVFFEQFLYIGNGKIPVNASSVDELSNFIDKKSLSNLENSKKRHPLRPFG